jgi:hypothetical protein
VKQKEASRMNISFPEFPLTMIAKTCNCKSSSSASSTASASATRKVTYTFVDSYHNLYIDKKDIILAEIHASERLLKYISDKDDEDRQLVEKEISELKMSVDLML